MSQTQETFGLGKLTEIESGSIPIHDYKLCESRPIDPCEFSRLTLCDEISLIGSDETFDAVIPYLLGSDVLTPSEPLAAEHHETVYRALGNILTRDEINPHHETHCLMILGIDEPFVRPEPLPPSEHQEPQYSGDIPLW